MQTDTNTNADYENSIKKIKKQTNTPESQTKRTVMSAHSLHLNKIHSLLAKALLP